MSSILLKYKIVTTTDKPRPAKAMSYLSDLYDRVAVRIPLYWKLMISVFVAASFIVAEAANSLHQQKILIDMAVTDTMTVLQNNFHRHISKETRELATALEVFRVNQEFIDIFLTKNRDSLYDLSLPLFETLKHKHDITHLYFINLDGTCFLRVHNKDLYGDDINRITFNQSKRTGDTAAGVELGKTAFALRVVMPYYNKDRDGKKVLIGFVEFGKEIDNLLHLLKEDVASEVTMLAEKTHLDQNAMSEMTHNSGHTNTWDRMSKYYQLGATFTTNSPFQEYITEHTIQSLNGDLNTHIPPSINGKKFSLGGFGFKDASGQTAGNILAFVDITKSMSIAEQARIHTYRYAGFLFILLLSAGHFGSRKLEQMTKERELINQINEIFLRDPSKDMYEQVLDEILNALKCPFGRFGFVGQSGLDFPATRVSNDTVSELVATPIMFQQALIGSLEVSKLSDQQTKLLQTIASHIAPPLQGRLEAARLEAARADGVLALERSLEKYRGLFENAGAMIFIRPLGGKLAETNKLAEDTFGYSKAEMTTITLLELLAPSSHAKFKAYRQQLMNSSHASFEALAIKKDGTTFPIEVFANKIPQGEKTIVMCIVRDISERKTLEAEKAARLQDLIIAFQQSQHQAANHFNPVPEAIQEQTKHIMELIDKFTASSNKNFPEFAQSLKTAIVNAQREIMALIACIEVLHRLKLKLETDRPNIATYIEDYIPKVLNVYNMANRVNYSLDLAEVPLGAESALALAGVIQDLLTNSCKYAFPGDSEGEIKINMSKSAEGLITIEYSDNGQGFPPDLDLDRPVSTGLDSIKGVIEHTFRGAVKIERAKPGVRVTMSFNEPEYNLTEIGEQ